MIVAMTGATGFIGRHLSAQLQAAGHEIRPLKRGWAATELDGASAVIHLAGETVAQRWTAAAKERIRSSRIDGTRRLVAALAKSSARPAVLLAASVVGIYGSRGDEILTEKSPPGSGFLADLTKEWEAAENDAVALDIRVVNLRFGVVLGRDGGGGAGECSGDAGCGAGCGVRVSLSGASRCFAGFVRMKWARWI